MTKKSVITLLIALLVFVITISLYINGQFKKPEFFFYDLQAKLLRVDKVSGQQDQSHSRGRGLTRVAVGHRGPVAVAPCDLGGPS